MSTSDVHAEACKIVKELCCLPLSVDQPAALIGAVALNIKVYLGIYSQQQKMLLS